MIKFLFLLSNIFTCLNNFTDIYFDKQNLLVNNLNNYYNQ